MKKKLIEFKKCWVDWIKQKTTFQKITIKAFCDIMFKEYSVYQKKQLLMMELYSFRPCFNVDCVYGNQNLIPIPRVIRKIELMTNSMALIHYDVFVTKMAKFKSDHPFAVIKKYNDPISMDIKYEIENFMFNDRVLVKEINTLLHELFLIRYKNMLNLSPYIGESHEQSFRLYSIQTIRL